MSNTLYKFKDDFINGVLPNTNGNPNILFKKGDVISGVEIERFIFNANTKGIMAKPTVVSAKVEEANGLVFIPLTKVEKIEKNVNDNTIMCIKAPCGDSGVKSTAYEPFLQKHKNHLVIGLVLVAGYFTYKKFKK